MRSVDPVDPSRQSLLFLFLYALAIAGGSIAYVPFLTIVLPIHAGAFSGANALAVLAQTAFAGAVAASVTNILFGWLSDLTQVRRPWIAGGLVASSAALLAMASAPGPAVLVGLVMLWQAFLNMMLSPLAAWGGDCVPDGQKGLLGGLMAFAPALGGAAGALITWLGPADVQGRLIMVVACVVACVGPVLVFGRPVVMRHLVARASHPVRIGGFAVTIREAARRMWLARFLVQIAEASLFSFQLLWLRSLDASLKDYSVAAAYTAILGVAALVALWTGRWADKAGRPILPLAVSALVTALGLAIMACASSLPVAFAGYAVFGVASSVFLALHSSQALRVVGDHTRRGRNLGLFNLTNTVPSLVMPWLVVSLTPTFGFSGLFGLLSLLALAAFALLRTRKAGG